MRDITYSIENFWGNILSRDPEIIQSTLDLLDYSSRKRIIKHLQTMVFEPGWQPEQRLSAKIALEIAEQNNGR